MAILEVVNPGQLDEGLVAVHQWSLDQADMAVVAAERAFSSWSDFPQDVREDILRHAQTGLRSRKSILATSIAQEMGKPLAQAELEVDTMVAKFDITLPDAREILTPRRHPDEPSTTIRGVPRGVTAVVGPYNFPGHLVNGMVLPALATGNTVVLKPASVTPGIWRLVTEIFAEAGLPAGVLNYVVGNYKVGQRLASHPDVDTLLFTGGVNAGRALKAAAADTHKEVKLEMGGQGVALVLDDADVEKVADMVAKGATIRGGQNCNSTRSVFTVGPDMTRRMTEALRERFARLKIGYQFDAGIDMGPLATDPATGFRRDLQAVLDLGAEILFESPLPAGLPRGHYAPAVFYRRPPDTFRPRDTSEIFGPALGITEVADAEEGLDLMNWLHLRLSAAIHSTDSDRARALARRSRWGQTVINGPTVGASSKVDFAGMGEATYGGAGGRAMTSHTVEMVNIVESK